MGTATVPETKFAGVEIGKRACVGPDGFFFEISDETVAGPGGGQIADEEAVEEYPLCTENHGSHEDAGGVEFEEREEVHALVEGFFDEGFDPGERSEKIVTQK